MIALLRLGICAVVSAFTPVAVIPASCVASMMARSVELMAATCDALSDAMSVAVSD